jgi:hypothetical protein
MRTVAAARGLTFAAIAIRSVGSRRALLHLHVLHVLHVHVLHLLLHLLLLLLARVATLLLLLHRQLHLLHGHAATCAATAATHLPAHPHHADRHRHLHCNSHAPRGHRILQADGQAGGRAAHKEQK